MSATRRASWTRDMTASLTAGVFLTGRPRERSRRGRPVRAADSIFINSASWGELGTRIDICQYRSVSHLPDAPVAVNVDTPRVPGAAWAVAPCCPPLTSGSLTVAEAETMAGMFKALSDPVRVRLFSRIASHPEGEACVCDISDVGVSQPTVSHHLRKLREAGLLTSERRGTWVYYRVAPGVLAAMSQMLTGTG